MTTCCKISGGDISQYPNGFFCENWQPSFSITMLADHLPTRPGKLSKVHFSRKFQGRVHLNFWLSRSPISPYFYPKNLPISPKVYLLKVQSKASNDFHCPLWQAFPKCSIFVLKKCFLRMLVHVTYHYSIWNAFQSLSSNKSSFDGKFISRHMRGFEMF